MLNFLSNPGILGMNARNLLYVKPFNPRKAVAFADNKLKTKAFLAARGIPAAKLFARIENRDQLHEFDFDQLPNECVLKPNYGFGGEGIVIFRGRDANGNFLKNGKTPFTKKELVEHIEDILDGMFSVNGRRDTAFFEQVLTTHECFAKFRPVGLPDIRIIVFNLVPVMAMVRIPTAQSGGKANVHLGGIGIGLDIAKGITTHAVQYNKQIHELPHGGSPSGISIPYWDDMLLHCSRIQQLTNVGFLAVDLTIDQQQGPMLLEVNARAGLMVQIANLAPLGKRLERVKGIRVTTPEKGVRMAKDLFGGRRIDAGAAVDEDAKPILGTHESIIISGSGTTVEVPCVISPDHERTVFTPQLIKSLADTDALEVADKKEKTYRVKFTLAGKKIQTLVGTGEVLGEDRAMIGRRDLTGFLIDPSKTQPTVPAKGSASVKTDLRAVDKMIAQVDRELLLLKHIKPVNLAEERDRLEQDKLYNPVFSYSEPAVDLEEARRRIDTPVEDDSPLGQLLEKKRLELQTRIDLIEARGDTKRFTELSKALFGAPTSGLIRSAKAFIHNREACELPISDEQLLNSEQVEKIFSKALERYSLHDWQVAIRSKLVADVTVGGKHVYIREAALFEPVRVDALVAHEIETHILSAENGSHQPYDLFRNGCAGYIDTQEGLAVYNQNRVYGPHHDKRYGPAQNLLGLSFGLQHSFAETRQYLEEELGMHPAKALSQAITIKRGLNDTSEAGGFTKGVVYFRGLRAIEQFIKDDGDLAELYVGKIALEDLEHIRLIEELEAPLLLPSFLRETDEPAPKQKKQKKKKKAAQSEVENVAAE